MPPEATLDANHRSGDSATLTGWGATKPGGLASTELGHAAMMIFAEKYCNKSRIIMNNQEIESESLLVPNLFHSPVFCAGLPIEGFTYLKLCDIYKIFVFAGYHAGVTGLTCGGDSGSPLVIFDSEDGHYVQIGIVSGGICQSWTDPSIFARIEDHQTLEFIRKQSWDHIPPNSVKAIKKLMVENKDLTRKYTNLEDKVMEIFTKMVRQNTVHNHIYV